METIKSTSRKQLLQSRKWWDLPVWKTTWSFLCLRTSMVARYKKQTRLNLGGTSKIHADIAANKWINSTGSITNKWTKLKWLIRTSKPSTCTNKMHRPRSRCSLVWGRWLPTSRFSSWSTMDSNLSKSSRPTKTIKLSSPMSLTRIQTGFTRLCILTIRLMDSTGYKLNKLRIHF